MNAYTYLFLSLLNAVVLMAPSAQVLEVAVEACERIILNQEDLALPDANGYDDSLSNIGTFEIEAEEVTSLVEFPEGASLMAVVFHVILLPVKGLVHCEFCR